VFETPAEKYKRRRLTHPPLRRWFG
jgi:hypothetical protein